MTDLPQLEKFEVRNRWTDRVQFTAEIAASPEILPSVKLGLAVKWALKSGVALRSANLSDADLSGANLSGAYLSYADLSGAILSDANLRDAILSSANLSYADLSGANLRDANLRDANLRSANLSYANLRGAILSGATLRDADLRQFKADLWLILAMAHNEVPSLIAALKNGKVDGSTYEGACACLVGTLQNAGASGLPHVADSPAESWFAAIKKGDKPGDDSEGGFRAQKALEWAEEYQRCTGEAA